MSIEMDESVTRLSRDLVTAAKVLSDQEVRFLVDAYYAMQTTASAPTTRSAP